MMSAATADTYAQRLEQTWPELRDRVQRAAGAAGRSASSVRIVAVTKSHPLEAVDAAVAAGLRDLGENRVEELERKVAARGRDRVTWHMIGHVQGRKAKRVVDLAHLTHSVDSEGLAERMSRIGVEESKDVHVLVQVNTSGEGSKSGFPAEAAVEVIHRVSELPRLRVGGLMTMAPWVEDEAVLRDAFRGLREIGDALRRAGARVGTELSMGMTNDLDIAIQEGSTMIRVGTALFGERRAAP